MNWQRAKNPMYYSILCLLVLFVTPLLSSEIAIADSFMHKIAILPIFNEPAHENLAFADFLYENDMTYEAITEYKRYLFHNQDAKDSDYARFKIAMGLVFLNDLSGADKALEDLSFNANQEIFGHRAKLISALLYIKSNDFHRAVAELEYLIRVSPKERIGEIQYFLAWVKLFKGEDEEAIDLFSQLLRDPNATRTYTSAAYGIHRFISHNPAVTGNKIPNLARFVSGILPGAGQMYAGDVLSGINSTVLNGSIAYFVINNISLGNYFQAAYIFYFLWRRYYFGGIELAGEKAIEFNDTMRSYYLLSLMNAFIPKVETS